jgi:hypothetical protein
MSLKGITVDDDDDDDDEGQTSDKSINEITSHCSHFLTG